MTGDRDFERELKALEARMTEKIATETAQMKFGLFKLIAARSVVLAAILEELDAEQVERIKARSVAAANDAAVRKHIEDWFNPSEDD